jgi:chorismate mutase
MIVKKTKREQKLFEKYKKWLQADHIPDHIIENYKKEINKLKK